MSDDDYAHGTGETEAPEDFAADDAEGSTTTSSTSTSWKRP